MTGNKFNWGFDWQNFVVGLVCVEALQWNIGVRHSFFGWLVCQNVNFRQLCGWVAGLHLFRNM